MVLLAPMIMIKAQCPGNSTYRRNVTVSVRKTTIQTTFYKSTGLTTTTTQTKGSLFKGQMVVGKLYSFRMDYPDGKKRAITMSRKGYQVTGAYYYYYNNTGRISIDPKTVKMPYKKNRYEIKYVEKFQSSLKYTKRQSLVLSINFKCSSSGRIVMPQVGSILLGVLMTIVIGGFQKQF